MNIISFIEDQRFIGDKSLSLPQIVCLKSIYGLPLNKEERKVYRKLTSLKKYHPKEYQETTIIAGRRSGKSNQLASNVCIFEATMRDHKTHLSVGEKAFIVLVASNKRQARVIFNYVLGKLRGSEVLNKMIESVTTEEIRLSNRITIAIYPCSEVSIRGLSIVVFIADESAFWKVDGVNVDKSVINSVRPSLIQFPNSKLIKISSPYAKKGVIFQDFEDHFGVNSDVLVIQGETHYFNPQISKKFIKDELKKDYSYASSEYLARFRSDLEGYLSPEALEAIIIPGRLELPKIKGIDYHAFVDPSGGRGDAMTLSVCHKEDSGKIIQDCIRIKKAPFDPGMCVKEFAKVLKSYDLYSCTGDRYSGEWCSSAFQNESILYKNSSSTKSQIYLEFLPLVMQARVELLDHKEQKVELLQLERRTGKGQDSVDHPRGLHDDISNSCAGSCVLSGGIEERLPLPSYGFVEEVPDADNSPEALEEYSRTWLLDDRKTPEDLGRLGRHIDEEGNIISIEELLEDPDFNVSDFSEIERQLWLKGEE